MNMGQLTESAALIVDDDAGVRQSLRLCLEADGARVLGVSTSSGALEALERSRFDVVLLDLWLGAESGLELLSEIVRRQRGIAVVVITAFASFETAVSAMKLGAVDYLPKPFTPTQVREATRRVVQTARDKKNEVDRAVELTQAEVSGYFSSENAQFAALLKTAERAAGADCVVMLSGESGTGKNILAKFLHDKSPRAKAPFVAVNCPTLSSDMMTSALFGHKKGSFTGAVQDKIGLFEEAEQGTIFLDEVNSMAQPLQTKLLRVLQERQIRRVGDTKNIPINVRVLAATNESLGDKIKGGNFREDLYYRLAVIPVEMPALRERPDDIPLLISHFLQKNAAQTGTEAKKIDPKAVDMLALYRWPGNVRELENAVERACALCDDGLIRTSDLPPQVIRHASSPTVEHTGTLPVGQTLDEYIRDQERRYIEETIKFNGNSREKAAKMLGISMATLYRKLEVKAQRAAEAKTGV